MTTGEAQGVMEGRDPGEPKDWKDSDEVTPSGGGKADDADTASPIGGPASEH